MREDQQGLKAKANSRFLTFNLGSEEFAIPLLGVREVLAVPDITPIPYTPSYYLGMMNLRGQVISVIDLRLKFGLSPKNSPENAVIICDLGGLSLGVVVDSINSVTNPSPEELSNAPAGDDKKTDYISGVFRSGQRLILLIDIVKTLNLEDHQILKKSLAKAA